MKECPSCGMEVEKNSTECMYCHYEFPKYNKGYAWVAIVLAILIMLWIIL